MAGGMKRLAGETAIYGVSSIVGKFLNWMLVPMYTRVLATESDFGIVTNLYAWTALLMVILTYGMETGFFRFMNKKEIKLAMRGVLSGKLRDNELVIVDDYGFEKPSTKQAVALLKALGLEGKRVTLVVSDDDIYTYLSFRNVETVRVIGVGEASTHSLIDNAALVLSSAVAKKLEEVLA